MTELYQEIIQSDFFIWMISSHPYGCLFQRARKYLLEEENKLNFEDNKLNFTSSLRMNLDGPPALSVRYRLTQTPADNSKTSNRLCPLHLNGHLKSKIDAICLWEKSTDCNFSSVLNLGLSLIFPTCSHMFSQTTSLATSWLHYPWVLAAEQHSN